MDPKEYLNVEPRCISGCGGVKIVAVAGIVVADRAVATRWIFAEHEHTMTVRLIMEREKGDQRA